MKRFFLILFFLSLVVKAGDVWAQSITWQREYTSYNEVEGSTVVQLSNGDYIFCGQSVSNKFIVLRTDNLGDPIWKKDFEGLYPRKIIQTLDSGVLIVGYTFGKSGISTDSYLLKLNLNGDSLWSRKYGLLSNQDQITDVLELESGNLLMLGWSRFSDMPSIVKMFLLKTNLNGDSIRMDYYDNSGGSSLISKLNNKKILLSGSTAMLVDTNGVINAFTYAHFGKGVGFENKLYFVKDTIISGSRNLKITKTNERFEIIDFNYISFPNKILYEQNLIKYEKGIISCGIVINNTTGEAGGYILSLDSDCKILWFKDYFLSSRNLKFEGLSASSDKGFIVVGDTYQLSNGILYMLATKTDSLGNTSPLKINNQSMIINKGYFLYQNFPNPFNSQTTIKFDLIRKSNVKLSIFNILGESIMTLVNDNLEIGTHKFIYSTDSDLPSGLYFYSLQVSTDFIEFVETKKFLLLK